MKEFDLEAAKAGAPVQTRGGYPVRIVAYDRLSNDYPIVALVKAGDEDELLLEYEINGKFYKYSEGEDNSKDLVMVPAKKTGWINVYMTGKKGERQSSMKVYGSKEEALKYTSESCLDTVQIEWEE